MFFIKKNSRNISKMKKRVLITIDPDVYKWAKASGISISFVTNKHLLRLMDIDKQQQIFKIKNHE